MRHWVPLSILALLMCLGTSISELAQTGLRFQNEGATHFHHISFTSHLPEKQIPQYFPK